MMWRIYRILHRTISGRSGGFTLIEVTVAIVVLSLVVATIPPLMVMVIKSEFRQNEHRIAESMTRSQMEFIKSQSYTEAGNCTAEPYDTIPPPNDTYEIKTIACPVQVDTSTGAVSLLPDGPDGGIQEITVEIWHADRLVLETKGLKVDR